VDDKRKKIFQKTHIAIDENAVDKLSGNLLANNSQFNDESLKLVLMRFFINDSAIIYTGRDYWDYVHYFPYVNSGYAQKEVIDDNLKDHVIRQYLYCVADSIGILKDIKFCLDKRIFVNKQLRYYYDITEFQKYISVTDKELSDYYEQNKATYKSHKVSVLSILTFRNEEAAITNRNAVSDIISRGRYFALNDTSLLKGLLSYQPNLRIENNSRSFPPELINNIFSLPENQLSTPFNYNNNYLLFFVTKREGAAIHEFSEVKDQIKTKLINDKFNKLRNQRVLDLKKKYTITVNKIKTD
jgi:hypothetical protein